MSRRRPAHRRTRPSRAADAHPAGAVLIVALLAMTLLASAVLYIINVGTHVQRRIEAQHAADAAAIAGAGWVARSLNLVALNNVETTRLLAQVQVLDALPLAVRNSAADVNAAIAGLDYQLNQGLSEPALTPHPWLEAAVRQARADLVVHQDILSRIEPQINDDNDLAAMTHYRVGVGKGTLWQAIEALQDVSVTAMEQMPIAAQTAAVAAARANLSDDDGRGFLVPFVPQVPWQLGEPADFVQPITQGLLPADRDDEQFARGPFDVLFGFRRYTHTGSEFVGPEFQVPQGSDYPLVRFNQNIQLANGRVTQYNVVGISEFFRQQLERAEDEAFAANSRPGDSSWFYERARDTSRQHFASLENILDGSAADPAVIPMAEWNDSFDDYEQRLISTANIEVLYLYLEYEPTPVGLGQTPVLQNWGFLTRTPWERINLDGTNKLTNRIFQMQRTGRFPQGPDPNRDHVQNFYILWCAFQEPNARPRFRDPNNFNSVDDLPAPVQLNLEQLPHEGIEPDAAAAARDTHLRFFAAADQPATATLWSGLFEGNATTTDQDTDQTSTADFQRPWRRTAAIASAEVFNNHSWDLWTQMWHAQLAPVEDLEAWLDLMQRTGSVTVDDDPNSDRDLGDVLDVNQVGDTFRYLRSITPLMQALEQTRPAQDTPTSTASE